MQAGGGVRGVDAAAALADAGVARVVMGSAAVADPSLVDQVARIVPVAVGLDHRAGQLAVHGWTELTDVALDDALRRFPSAAAFIVTDISRDGLLSGPDLDGLASAVAATDVPVIASGGVSSLDDVRALARSMVCMGSSSAAPCTSSGSAWPTRESWREARGPVSHASE